MLKAELPPATDGASLLENSKTLGNPNEI